MAGMGTLAAMMAAKGIRTPAQNLAMGLPARPTLPSRDNMLGGLMGQASPMATPTRPSMAGGLAGAMGAQAPANEPPQRPTALAGAFRQMNQNPGGMNQGIGGRLGGMLGRGRTGMGQGLMARTRPGFGRSF